jgi:hypothetical protein
MLGALWELFLLLLFSAAEGSSGPSLRGYAFLCLGPVVVAGGALRVARRSGARWRHSVITALAISLTSIAVAFVLGSGAFLALAEFS